MTPVLVVFAILFVAAVAGAAWWCFRRRDGSRIFEGTFTFGWEVSMFVPSGSAATEPRYWLVWTPESGFMERFRKQGFDPAWTPGYGSVRTKFAGTLQTGSNGGYGHMGQYAGEVTVRRVLEMSPADVRT